MLIFKQFLIHYNEIPKKNKQETLKVIFFN